MEPFAQLAEARITEAMARGDFEDLPGKGKRLDLSDDPLVATELRMAYRILKNAGYVPPEVALRKEINHIQTLLAELPDTASRAHTARRLNLLYAKLSAQRGEETPMIVEQAYRGKLLARMR